MFTEVHAKRLLHLARQLPRVAALRKETVRFNMSTFVSTLSPRSSHCGASCCAFGFAGLMPFFRQLGLVTTLPDKKGRGEDLTLTPQTPLDRKTHKEVCAEYGITKGELSGFEAARVLFGLTERESEHLFAYDNNLYEGPDVVAARITKFVYEKFPRMDPANRKKKAVPKC